MSSVKCGIVGLPNVGKSTLFNALLKKRVALSANYPFATVEPNVGVVVVPDPRLAILADVVKAEENMATPPPLVPAVVEFVDIAGLVKGASTGAGLGNQFLSHIREVDAIVHVLRDFKDENVVLAGSESPEADKQVVETELALSDLQILEKLIAAKDPIDQQKLQILKQVLDKLSTSGAQDDLNVGKSIRLTINSFDSAQDLRDERLTSWFSHLPLLSIKPVLYVYNVSESHLGGVTRDEDNSMVICAKLEEELADLPEQEQGQYLKEIGIEETGLERLIKKAYSLLGLISFLTAGRKEVRAWTIKRGETALRASGVIHTDFMKKFIRAEVVEYEKLIEAGSHVTAKQKGWIRTEGKDYLIKDGDVVEFLIGS